MMKTVSAHIKGRQPSTTRDKTCVIGVSVGQKSHENEALRSTLICLKEAGFTSFVFLIADSLQRYTLAIKHNSSPEEHHNSAVMEGKSWEAKSQGIISDILPAPLFSVAFFSWEEARGLDEFNYYHKKISDLYKEENSFLYKEINKTKSKFIQRIKSQNSKIQTEPAKIRLLSAAYIIEECAALTALVKEKKWAYFAYSGSPISAFTATKSLFFPEEESLDYLEINLRTKKTPSTNTQNEEEQSDGSSSTVSSLASTTSEQQAHQNIKLIASGVTTGALEHFEGNQKKAAAFLSMVFSPIFATIQPDENQLQPATPDNPKIQSSARYTYTQPP